VCGAALVLVGLAARAAVEESPAEPHTGLEIRDWFALGSGCRALPTGPRDVEVALVGVPDHPQRYRVSVRFADYELDGEQPPAPGVTRFARECGVRLAVYPPVGTKLSNVAADVPFVVAKDAGAAVRLRSRLFLGDVDLEYFEALVPAAEAVSRDYPVTLRPSPEARTEFARLRCGQPKIIGLDVSAAVLGDDAEARVNARVRGGLAVITIELGECEAIGRATAEMINKPRE
jgi:hypothetical protein